MVKLAAIQVMGQQLDSRAVLPLIELLKKSLTMSKHSAEKIRNSVFQALGKMDDVLIVAPLVELLDGDEQKLLKALRERLEKITDPAAADALIEYPQSDSIRIRRAVITILGELKH